MDNFSASTGSNIHPLFESLSITWSTAKIEGTIDQIQEILNTEKGEQLTSRRTEWGETFFWKQANTIDLGDSHWLQIAPEELSSDLSFFIVAVDEPDHETSVFSCSPFESATHYTRAWLARQLKQRKNIDLATKLVRVSRQDMVNLSNISDRSIRIIGFTVATPDGIATVSYPSLAPAKLREVITKLDESQHIITIWLEIAGLKLKVQPRSNVGGEPIVIADLLASREILGEALARLALAFDRLENPKLNDATQGLRP
jgi:hypothetical protein